MGYRFRECTLDQPLLMAPSLQEWLPENHLARFIADVTEQLDLAGIYAAYERRDGRGQVGYHPLLLTRLLLYGYAVGVASSRGIERKTYDDVAFRYLAADQHPDHDTIANFRQQHLSTLAGLFTQALQLCQKAGLVRLGHVALEGSKLQANASKHKAMSCGRMNQTGQRLREEVEELLRRAQEAKAALEAEACEEAEKKKVAAEAKIAERRAQEECTGKKPGGRDPQIPDPEKAVPEEKAQRNFTDPESRIMPDGSHKGSFVQAFNAQIAVDSEAQIILAAEITQESNDKRQLAPMLQQVEWNTGNKPAAASADTGYFSAEQVTDERVQGIDLYVAIGKQKHGEPESTGVSSEASPPPEDSERARMQQKLKTEQGKATYKMRKAIVEPVFGQIKEWRGFRRFSLRGLEKAGAEWKLICLTHNLLKLFRSGWVPQTA